LETFITGEDSNEEEDLGEVHFLKKRELFPILFSPCSQPTDPWRASFYSKVTQNRFVMSRSGDRNHLRTHGQWVI
jgi:hypothetical protein